MKQSRENHSPSFKAKVALEALKEEETTAEVFTSRPMEATNGGMIESLTLDTLRTVGHDLNKAPVLS
ncbi:MAG: hypothetical protein O2783_05995 [Chloroflexi bacterium]|nr:hypothetical protein [Chloroflexota bacterium]